QPAQTPAAVPSPRQALPGPAAAKIAIINIQTAILNSKDGQKAAADVQAKFNPRKTELDKKRSEVDALQDQLRKGSATMSDEAKARLQREIDSGTKDLNRRSQDLNDDLEQEQGRIMQDLGAKMMKIVEEYATQNGYSVVLDVSNPQTDVLWAAASTNITPDIVRLYDQAHPGMEAAKPPAAAKPAPAAKRP
ncbi:MAG: OmpH family outer membrane protein, partial [Bryobacteraceae bacterium]